MAVDEGPDGDLYSVQYRSQQRSHAHDRGEQGDEATTRHRAAQNPDDSVIDKLEAQNVDEHGQDDQWQARRPVAAPVPCIN